MVAYMDAFVASFNPPLREGVAVRHLRSDPQHGFMLDTTDGIHFAEQVVVAPAAIRSRSSRDAPSGLPADIVQIHSSLYRNPRQLPEGAVLVVGSGQSGCQIAEDLHLAGRKVHLCVGDAPRVARRYRGKDVVEWLHLMGYYDLPVHEHPLREGVRDKTNHYVTGRDGGRDIDLRQRAREGMELYGRLLDVSGDNLLLADDLARCLDQADQVSESIKTSIDGFIAKQAIAAPEEARYRPLWTPPHERAAARLSRRRRRLRRLVYRLSHRLQLDRSAAVQRARQPESCTRGHSRCRRLLSWAPLALHVGLGTVLRCRQGCRASGGTHQDADRTGRIRAALAASTKPLSAREFRFPLKTRMRGAGPGDGDKCCSAST